MKVPYLEVPRNASFRSTAHNDTPGKRKPAGNEGQESGRMDKFGGCRRGNEEKSLKKRLKVGSNLGKWEACRYMYVETKHFREQYYLQNRSWVTIGGETQTP